MKQAMKAAMKAAMKKRSGVPMKKAASYMHAKKELQKQMTEYMEEYAKSVIGGMVDEREKDELGAFEDGHMCGYELGMWHGACIMCGYELPVAPLGPMDRIVII